MKQNPQPLSETHPISPEKKHRRPALVWITQALLLPIMLMMAVNLIFALPKTFSSSAPLWQILYALAYAVGILSLSSTLFVGLAKAKRWSWHGSILFATLILVLVFYNRAHPSTSVSQIPADQLLGAAIAELLITILVVMYPIRLFFSKNVRAFLGIK